MRHQGVSTGEDLELRPYRFEPGRGLDIRGRVPVHGARLGLDRHPRLDQAVELLDDLPVAHPDRGDLDNFGRPDVAPRRLEVDHDEILEIRHRRDIGELERLEGGQRHA